jgi:hypothetical protein
MTQAFNLAQLASNLNTSGQLDGTDGLTGLVANANLASSGTASSSTFLFGDRTWKSVTFGKVVQVATQTVTSTVATTSGSMIEITSSFRTTLTPQSASNKILIIFSPALANAQSDSFGIINMYRGVGGTNLTGTTFSAPCFGYTGNNEAAGTFAGAFIWLDSPATTSAVTYTPYWAVVGGTLRLNNGTNNDNQTSFRGTSNLTIMEVQA